MAEITTQSIGETQERIVASCAVSSMARGVLRSKIKSRDHSSNDTNYACSDGIRPLEHLQKLAGSEAPPWNVAWKRSREGINS